MGHAPLPQLSGAMVQLRLLSTRVPTISRWQPLASHDQFYSGKKRTLNLPAESGPDRRLRARSRGRHRHKEPLEAPSGVTGMWDKRRGESQQ